MVVFFRPNGKWVHTHNRFKKGGNIMATNDQTGLEEKNRELRKMLAALRIHSDKRKPGETLQEENRRLQEELRWYQRLLKDA
jgi:cell shape-determining protein MreC